MMKNKVEPLALGREKRINAGSKMQQMITAEEDDFYKQTYGGFEEEENDNEYEESESDSDVVDSDFSIDENDEVISADEDEDGKKRAPRGRGVYTKAYKEPKRAPAKVPTKSKKGKEPAKRRSSPPPRKEPTPKKRSSPVKRPPFREELFDSFDDSMDGSVGSCRKSARTSTKLKSEETRLRSKIYQAESEIRKAKANQSKVKYRQLTQAELLEEAKATEQENIASLEKYQRMELEKAKKSKVIKKGIVGPFIRTISTGMPIDYRPAGISESEFKALHESGQLQGAAKVIERHESTSSEASSSSQPTVRRSVRQKERPKDKPTTETETELCMRNFLIFSEENLLEEQFKKAPAPMPHPRNNCIISQQPAKYWDPVTRQPFANLAEFEKLRKAYTIQLEKLKSSSAEVQRWQRWTREHPNYKPPKVERTVVDHGPNPPQSIVINKASL